MEIEEENEQNEPLIRKSSRIKNKIDNNCIYCILETGDLF